MISQDAGPADVPGPSRGGEGPLPPPDQIEAPAPVGGAGSIEVSPAPVPTTIPAALPGREAPIAAPQPQTLTRTHSVYSGCYRVHWTVDAWKLRGNDKQAVSPPFDLCLGSQLPSVTFKMILYPKVMNDNRGGASFKKSHGRGFIQLKCESDLSGAQAIANVNFRISIGSGVTKQ